MIQAYHRLFEDNKKMIKYMIIGLERCPSTGREHIQGYIHFHNAVRYSTLEKLRQKHPCFCGKWHQEGCKGSPQQNIDYCKKEGKFHEFGVAPLAPKEKGAKAKAQLEGMWELAKAGDFEALPPQHIKTWEYIYSKYGHKPQDSKTLNNFWIHGSTGTGKSRIIRELLPTEMLFSKPLSQWWDSYAGQPVIIIEDIDPSHQKWITHFIKIWTDHYAFNAPVKGSHLWIRPPVIIVTSQYHIEEVFLGTLGVQHHSDLEEKFNLCASVFPNRGRFNIAYEDCTAIKRRFGILDPPTEFNQSRCFNLPSDESEWRSLLLKMKDDYHKAVEEPSDT